MRRAGSLAAACVLLVAGGATASTVQRVGPGAMGGWSTSISTCGLTSSTASVVFADGPGAPPLGPGSARLRAGSDGASVAMLRYTAATALVSEIASLSYATHVVSSMDVQAPYLQLEVDLDADGDGDDTLLFEPAYQTPSSGNPSLPDQGPVMRGAWQTWDARGGGWWATATPGFAPGTGVRSLDAYVAARPGARLATGGVAVAAGCGAPSWDGFDGAVDAVRVAVAGADLTFDLEADAVAPETSITEGPSGTVSSATARFGFAASEPGATFRCALDGGAPIPCSTPFDTGALPDGVHTFVVAAADAAGNADATPATRTWTIDTPPAPVIGTPADGAHLPFAAVRLSGSAQPGVRVQVTEGTALLGDVPVGPDGRWTLDRTFTNGPHTVVARAREGTNVGPSSAPRTFTVDTVAPAAPQIGAPAQDAVTGPAVTISGTAEPSAGVVLSDQGAVVGSVTADATGAFSAGLTLPEGRRAITAQAIDRAGNRSPVSPARGFDVDATPPSVAIDTQNNAVLISPAGIAGRATDVTGVSRIEVVYVDQVRGGAVGAETAACPACGTRGTTFAWTARADLPPGYYLAVVTAYDLLGNRSPARHVAFVRL